MKKLFIFIVIAPMLLLCGCLTEAQEKERNDYLDRSTMIMPIGNYAYYTDNYTIDKFGNLHVSSFLRSWPSGDIDWEINYEDMIFSQGTYILQKVK